MDAIKFIKEANKMCNSHDFCNGCPAFDSLGPCKILHSNNYSAEEKLSIVEEWAKKHSIKTRQSVFLEQYPNASVIEGGTIGICPKALDKDHECFRRYFDIVDGQMIDCLECKKRFWMQEVE